MYDELTKEDIQKMQEELDYRTRELRPKLIEDVKTARAFGDLSENFEYKAAKREKNRNDSRVRYLERMIKTARVISGSSAGDAAGLYDRVTIRAEDDGKSEEKGRQRQRERRPHAGADFRGDVSAAVALPEFEREKRQAFLEEDRAGRLFEPRGLRIPKEGILKIMRALPGFDRLGRDVLAAQIESRHVVGRIDGEKEQEREEIHAEEHERAVQKAAQKIERHHASSLRSKAVLRVRPRT